MKAVLRKCIGILLSLLLFLLLILLSGWFFMKNFVILNGKPCSRSTEQLSFYGGELPDLNVLAELKELKQLDLRNTGLTLGEHEWLQRKLPDCEIRWQVQFQGKSYLPDTRYLTVSSLTEGDLILLDYLPELEEIDARACRDYGVLGKLMKTRSDCRVLCRVELGGEIWDQDTEGLTLENADMEELLGRLCALPRVKEVRFTGKLPTTGEINALTAAYPEIRTQWQVEVLGKTYEKDQESLDFSLQTIADVQGLKEQLLYFPYLKTLDFRGVRMSEKDRTLLETHYPQVTMLFDYDLDGVSAPVDTEILDLSGHSLVTLQEIREALPYLPDLQKILLCDCGFSSEELAKFNRELEKIRVVWNVQVGGRNTRTDETYFAPNKWGLKMTDENIKDLRYCTDMVCVDIGHSKNVTSCEWAACMPELQYLILADSSVRGLEPLRNLKKLKFLELFLIPGQDLSPLQGCTALEDLNLCYVYTDPAPVQKMTWLKRLWWSGCWPARTMLQGTLKNTEMNFDTASSTGEGWREGKLYYEMRDFIGMGYMKG